MHLRFWHAIVGAVVLLMALMPAATAAQAAATPTPPFTQCPAVNLDTSCGILLVVNPDNTISVLGDPSQGPYDGSDDTLVGIVNNSSAAVPAITVTGPGSGLSLLDGDGLCIYAITGCPFGSTSYEGPGTSIKTDPTLPDEAEIDFAGAGLAAGANTYFSLEGTLTAASITSHPGTLSGVLSLNPATQNLAAGAQATVTARFLDSTGAPVAGKQVGFRVESGPDAGATGTCSSSCITDSSGQVKWTFTGSKTAAGATDTVRAWVDTNGDGVPSPGEPQAAAAVTWAAATACPPLKFFGVRGSGEKASQNGGYGPTVVEVKNELGKLVPGLSATAIDYQAFPVQWWNPNYAVDYEKSVEGGVNHLTSKFDAFAAKCSNTDVVFAGLSQGVDVIMRAYKALSPAERAHVLVAGLGDPHFNPRQTWIDQGAFNPRLQAILVHFWGDAPHNFSRSEAGHVQSWCAMGDPICNYDKTNLAVCFPLTFINFCIHQLYAQVGYAFDAAYWAYKAWQALP